jgi:hypothetical protein
MQLDVVCEWFSSAPYVMFHVIESVYFLIWSDTVCYWPCTIRHAANQVSGSSGWLAGGLANREREQLVGKLAPAGTSWLASYIDQLAEQERNIVAEKFVPKEVPKPPSLQVPVR